MAGHSKWANIKHRKGRADAIKGKIFSKIAKEIISAVKQGGSDPKMNPRLRLVLSKAKAVNVPNDIIERNIKKGAGGENADYFELSYELYGHGGVGIIVDIVTDNKNRISSDMRIATNKRGGTIASPGSVAFQFDRKSIFQIKKEGVDQEILFSNVLEVGAEDFDETEDFFIIIAAPELLYQVKESLDSLKVEVEEAEVQAIPRLQIECDEETQAANLALIEWIEELDDVDAVFHNMSL
jgi:YebC/PmpR family DNA-binding regulatory protein